MFSTSPRTLSLSIAAAITITGLLAMGLTPTASATQSAPKPDPFSIEKLLVARQRAAELTYTQAWEGLGSVYRIGTALVPLCTAEEVYSWSRNLSEAERDKDGPASNQLDAFQKHAKRLVALRTRVSAMVPEILPKWTNSAAAWYQLETDLWLAGEKGSPSKDSATYKALLKARLEAARNAYEGVNEGLGVETKIGEKAGFIRWEMTEEVHTWSVRWMEASTEMENKPEIRERALQDHIQRMKSLRERLKRLTPETFPKLTLVYADWYLNEADILLNRRKNENVPFPLRLLASRRDLADLAYTLSYESFGDVRRLTPLDYIWQTASAQEAILWSDRRLDARLEMAHMPDERIRVLQEHLQTLQALQRRVEVRVPDVLPKWTSAAMTWYLTDTELRLAKRKAGKP